jgi:hypothetical protein
LETCAYYYKLRGESNVTDPRLTRIPPANAAAVEKAEHYEDEKLDIGP